MRKSRLLQLIFAIALLVSAWIEMLLKSLLKSNGNDHTPCEYGFEIMKVRVDLDLFFNCNPPPTQNTPIQRSE